MPPPYNTNPRATAPKGAFPIPYSLFTIPYSLFTIHYSLFPIPPFPLPLFLFSQKTGGKTAGICLLSLGKSVDETEKICYNMYQRATARRAAKKQSFGSDNREVFQ